MISKLLLHIYLCTTRGFLSHRSQTPEYMYMYTYLQKNGIGRDGILTKLDRLQTALMKYMYTHVHDARFANNSEEAKIAIDHV